MTDLLQKIQRQLDENHYVEAADIQALVDFGWERQWKPIDVVGVYIKRGQTKPVNVAVSGGDTWPAYCTNMGDGEIDFHTDEGITFENVTHWQPLPEGP